MGKKPEFLKFETLPRRKSGYTARVVGSLIDDCSGMDIASQVFVQCTCRYLGAHSIPSCTCEVLRRRKNDVQKRIGP